jgi:3-hydroxybutyryl-CoA dehydrogenase
MQIIVAGNEILKNEFLTSGLALDVDCIWVNDAAQFLRYPSADAYIDLLFEKSKDRILLLQQLLPKLVVINSVVHTLAETDAAFVRFNGWLTFLQSPLVEAYSNKEDLKATAEAIFQLFNKKMVWLADSAGFVTPKVVSMIINEAYFALSENVSTKEAIDTAMQLGTNYPYGPFEWSRRIGLKNIAALLNQLSLSEKQYQPCKLLVQEAMDIN